ncbi:hypothetical protein [Dethiosulfatarculus sandiegensis]|uniref:Uncharacterized protein n=1 Tax=Dethiosulfatarculus sandiegensis TaxID=1429043 RepID=A0A0D2JFH0_9BACT|nr:hypothetical protein [Dethiosulfatarculus sandiegensis]KIX14456.1 hypothetical protein X474_10215 [Dethiosulfatarculus sandiegensis]
MIVRPDSIDVSLCRGIRKLAGKTLLELCLRSSDGAAIKGFLAKRKLLLSRLCPTFRLPGNGIERGLAASLKPDVC